MEWFRENRIGVFIHYINIMFMLFIARSCYNIEGFSFLYVTLLYAFLMLVYWFFTGVLHRRIYRFLIVLAAAGLAVLIWFSFQNRIIEYFYSHVVYNIENINNQLFHGSVTYFYEFKPIITLVLPVVVFLLLFFYNNRMTEGVLLLVFMEVVFFWYLDYVDDIKRLIFPFIIISVITYLMNNYKKTVHEFQKKGIYSSLNGKRLIINIVVFSMVVGIIGLTLPQEIQGKDTMSIVERFQNKYAQAQDGVGSGLENIYGLQSSGYADTESRLGGPLTLDKSVAFLVESDKPYYLKGNVKDEYTGSSWKSTVNNYQKLENGEADSLNSIMNRYSSFINEPKQIKIYPEKLRTASFLVPMYTEKISNFNGDIYMNSENSTYMSSSRISKEYTIDFYELDENRISEDYYGMYYLGN
ncbi:MAG: hypothetical protein Q8930_09570, partial [Bacillota bacterium]|nr:hypothetical protein [Bacillota bacterium]